MKTFSRKNGWNSPPSLFALKGVSGYLNLNLGCSGDIWEVFWGIWGISELFTIIPLYRGISTSISPTHFFGLKGVLGYFGGIYVGGIWGFKGMFGDI